MQQQDTPNGAWANGITIKRTRDGYTWTVAVAATGSTETEIQEALSTATRIEEQIVAKYGK